MFQVLRALSVTSTLNGSKPHEKQREPQCMSKRRVIALLAVAVLGVLNLGGCTTSSMKPYPEGATVLPCQPNGGGPNFSLLMDTPSPAPVAPAASDFPTAVSDFGAAQGTTFLLGGCRKGAIVTISPLDAAMVGNLMYAQDGGVAVIAVAAKPGQSFLLRAWSDDGGAYLGQFMGT